MVKRSINSLKTFLAQRKILSQGVEFYEHYTGNRPAGNRKKVSN